MHRLLCRLAAMQRIVELCDRHSLENENDNLLQLRLIAQTDFLEVLKKARNTRESDQLFDELTPN